MAHSEGVQSDPKRVLHRRWAEIDPPEAFDAIASARPGALLTNTQQAFEINTEPSHGRSSAEIR